MATRMAMPFFFLVSFAFGFLGWPLVTEAVQCQSEVIAFRGSFGGPEDYVIRAFEDHVRDNQSTGISGYCDGCSSTNTFCITLELEGDIEIVGLPPGRGYSTYIAHPWDPNPGGYNPFERYESARVSRLIYRSCDFGLTGYAGGQWRGWICETLTGTGAYHKSGQCTRDYGWDGSASGSPVSECSAYAAPYKKAKREAKANSNGEPEQMAEGLRSQYCTRYPNKPYCRSRTITPTFSPFTTPSYPGPLTTVPPFHTPPPPTYYPPPPAPTFATYPPVYPPETRAPQPPPRPTYPPQYAAQLPPCSSCFYYPHKSNVRFATPQVTGNYASSLQPGVQMVLRSGSVRISCCNQYLCNQGPTYYPPAPTFPPPIVYPSPFPPVIYPPQPPVFYPTPAPPIIYPPPRPPPYYPTVPPPIAYPRPRPPAYYPTPPPIVYPPPRPPVYYPTVPPIVYPPPRPPAYYPTPPAIVYPRPRPPVYYPTVPPPRPPVYYPTHPPIIYPRPRPPIYYPTPPPIYYPPPRPPPPPIYQTPPPPIYYPRPPYLVPTPPPPVVYPLPTSPPGCPPVHPVCLGARSPYGTLGCPGGIPPGFPCEYPPFRQTQRPYYPQPHHHHRQYPHPHHHPHQHPQPVPDPGSPYPYPDAFSRQGSGQCITTAIFPFSDDSAMWTHSHSLPNLNSTDRSDQNNYGSRERVDQSADYPRYNAPADPNSFYPPDPNTDFSNYDQAAHQIDQGYGRRPYEAPRNGQNANGQRLNPQVVLVLDSSPSDRMFAHRDFQQAQSIQGDQARPDSGWALNQILATRPPKLGLIAGSFGGKQVGKLDSELTAQKESNRVDRDSVDSRKKTKRMLF